MFRHLDAIRNNVSDLPTARLFGRVEAVSGLVVKVSGLPGAAMGARVSIDDATSGAPRAAEVVGFNGEVALVMPYGPVDGLAAGSRVYLVSQRSTYRCGPLLLGRVLNALGDPVDGRGPLPPGEAERSLKASPPPAGRRRAVGPKMDMAVRTINTFLPICDGQRMGIFSGSGVGKSVLMSMMARFAEADVNVIGLVGERGREVKEFIEQQLGPEGLKKSVLIVATGDEPPLMRRQAAWLAMTIAEYFRDNGKKVMCFMDSVTRFAQAQREIGLSAGEPPTTRGYTPSVFAELPRLLERAGPGEENSDQGSITGIFTVLVEGNDMDEPVADAVRGIIDGHIILDRTLAERGHFPAIDVLRSISRMVPMCLSEQENQVTFRARRILATYNDMAELIRLGAYRPGADASVDEAIQYQQPLEDFMRQGKDEHSNMDESFATLTRIVQPLLNSPGSPAAANSQDSSGRSPQGET